MLNEFPNIVGTQAELDAILDAREYLYHNFPVFAEKYLVIRPKKGGVAPFIMNNAQKKVHELLEEQYRTTGRVRAVILKGRQMGITTYVQARFINKVTYEPGKLAYILTHQGSTTKEIFGLTKRFYDNLPEIFKPPISKNNTSELAFTKLDSKYAVGTAGTKEVGRGITVQNFHGSECAFWENGDEILAGLMNTIPDDNSEVILESTANGVNNVFHKYWNEAVAGVNGFIPIFISWAMDPTYRKDPPADFVRTQAEETLAELYQLDNAQLYWRRLKIAQSSEDIFKQEFPLCEAEAFLDSQGESFLKLIDLERARLHQDDFTNNPAGITIGVDPARGGDKTVLCFRRGRHVYRIDQYKTNSLVEVQGKVIRAINEVKPDRVFIDVCGLGWGIYDNLIEQGYKVLPVNSSERSIEPDRFKNKRAEMWNRMREWFETSPNRIPDDKALIQDLVAFGYFYTGSGQLQMEDKGDIKKRLGRSPDLADALALTFADPEGPLFNVKSKSWDVIKNRSEDYAW